MKEELWSLGLRLSRKMVYIGPSNGSMLANIFGGLLPTPLNSLLASRPAPHDAAPKR